jgi:hypothetical protein
MAGQTICPRCGSKDSFTKGYLPDTCTCRVCMSQLDWREIPGCGPDCGPASESDREGNSGAEEPGAGQASSEDETTAASEWSLDA